MKTITPLAAAALAVMLPMAACAQAPVAPTDMTLLSVNVTGEARVAPDIAVVSAGVVTQAATAGEAMRENANRMERVIAALRAAGVERGDIQTQSVQLNPDYRYEQNERPRITGYSARNTVSVRLDELEAAGGILDALVAEGANEINGPSFEVDDREAALGSAREDAMKKAAARAAAYAGAAGLNVARIVSITEAGSAAPPMPRPMMARAEMMGAGRLDTHRARPRGPERIGDGRLRTGIARERHAIRAAPMPFGIGAAPAPSLSASNWLKSLRRLRPSEPAAPRPRDRAGRSRGPRRSRYSCRLRRPPTVSCAACR